MKVDLNETKNFVVGVGDWNRIVERMPGERNRMGEEG